ncbi:MAG: radical SAM protein, partial [Candidatus Aenigmarchaeota archaeon]|nr:radical SAM protein [Candidatus Aenigmarchaeota archaeon]
YRGEGNSLTPKKAAEIMTRTRKEYGVNRMAISGGESTLNRPWLVQYIKELKSLNPDKNARFHVDTNGSLLTKDYIDELVEAGMTDVGIDLKSLNTETFMHITGLRDEKLVEKYKNTAWNATKYIIDNYKDKVFLGIGIPYNKDLTSIKEIRQMGMEIVKIDPEVQVCVLDYFPQFRRRDISRPSYWEMVEVQRVLKETGLKTVTCQTERGHIGP